MGAPHIMGFNHAAIGYNTVEEMFDAFSTSAHSQILAFFDFVRGPGGSSRRLEALKQRDFAAFAALYNGPGQAARYAGLLKDAVDALRAMRDVARGRASPHLVVPSFRCRSGGGRDRSGETAHKSIFVGVQNAGDGAMNLSARQLVRPLAIA